MFRTLSGIKGNGVVLALGVTTQGGGRDHRTLSFLQTPSSKPLIVQAPGTAAGALHMDGRCCKLGPRRRHLRKPVLPGLRPRLTSALPRTRRLPRRDAWAEKQSKSAPRNRTAPHAACPSAPSARSWGGPSREDMPVSKGSDRARAGHEDREARRRRIVDGTLRRMAESHTDNHGHLVSQSAWHELSVTPRTPPSRGNTPLEAVRRQLTPVLPEAIGQHGNCLSFAAGGRQGSTFGVSALK